MITPRRSADRGHADHGWLDARHTFSFANFHDPDHMGFSTLRVLNQDRVAPGRGFDTHGHRDMEIVTYVIEGALAHRDSMGNGSEMRPGEVQLMSAGSGVQHSEFNASSDEGLELLQMWVHPAVRGTTPRYEQREFPAADRRAKWRLVVSPDGADDSLTIGSDARLWLGLFGEGERASLQLGDDRSAWLHVARGSVEVNGTRLGPGDGAAIRAETEISVQGVRDGEEPSDTPADVLVWELPG